MVFIVEVLEGNIMFCRIVKYIFSLDLGGIVVLVGSSVFVVVFLYICII